MYTHIHNIYLRILSEKKMYNIANLIIIELDTI